MPRPAPATESPVAENLPRTVNRDLARRALVIDIEVRTRDTESPVETRWLAVNGIDMNSVSSIRSVLGCDMREARYGPIGFDYLHTARITCVTALPDRQKAVQRLQRERPRWKVTVSTGWQANITVTVPGPVEMTPEDFALKLRAAGLPTGPTDVTAASTTTSSAAPGFIINGYPLTNVQVTVMATILAEATAQQPTVSPGPPPPPLPPTS